jgi:hypothetical protein
MEGEVLECLGVAMMGASNPLAPDGVSIRIHVRWPWLSGRQHRAKCLSSVSNIPAGLATSDGTPDGLVPVIGQGRPA